MSRRLIFPAVLAVGLGACATVPPQLTGTYATVTPDNAAIVAQGAHKQNSKYKVFAEMTELTHDGMKKFNVLRG